MFGAEIDARQHCLATRNSIENIKLCYTNIEVKIMFESVVMKKYKQE